MSEEKPIRFYGTTWCGDCRSSKKVFANLEIPYLWIDIDENKQGEVFVKKTNKGSRCVPTIVFPDGTILVEPSDVILTEKLEALKF